MTLTDHQIILLSRAIRNEVEGISKLIECEIDKHVVEVLEEDIVALQQIQEQL